MGRLSLALSLGVLAVSSGYTLGGAIIGHRLVLGMVSGVLLLAGAIVGCLRLRSEPLPEALLSQLEQRESYEAAVQSAPRLGELLVHRYHWISQRDLERALSRQRRSGRRLGEILVKMRVISVEKLTRALVEHRVLKGEALPMVTPEAWTGRRES